MTLETEVKQKPCFGKGKVPPEEDQKKTNTVARRLWHGDHVEICFQGDTFWNNVIVAFSQLLLQALAVSPIGWSIVNNKNPRPHQRHILVVQPAGCRLIHGGYGGEASKDTVVLTSTRTQTKNWTKFFQTWLEGRRWGCEMPHHPSSVAFGSITKEDGCKQPINMKCTWCNNKSLWP
ncbi:unknown protein [Seminavis robusta]|uniref:Uncharacterized protein n=1 Tax=Seminavis robusta TaxID=568900 RepID=A0A9N8H5R7_9STRA|nr:unknown protein [Seminavis robusta]|eukprot:Sro81_g043461.1  (177) ;mRNA; r:49264-49794